MPSDFDRDILILNLEGLRKEVMRLRAGIRVHRDQKGHDRCWLDDLELYRLLPEGGEVDLTLPPEEEFLRECKKYHDLRKCGVKITIPNSHKEG